MNVTVFDILAIYMAGKGVSGFLKTKSKAFIYDLCLDIVLLLSLYGFSYANIMFVPSYLFMIINAVIVVDIVYLVSKKSNMNVFLIIFGALLAAIFFTSDVQTYKYVIFLIPLFVGALAKDCTEFDGYTTLSVLESIMYMFAFGFVGAWFGLCTSLLYFILSVVSYAKVNKFSALKAQTTLKDSKKKKKEKKEKE